MSSEAAACPTCAHPRKRGVTVGQVIKWIFVAPLAVMVFSCAYMATRVADTVEPSVAEAAGSDVGSERSPEAIEAAEILQGKAWKYEEYIDELTGKTVKTATLYSTNTVELTRPYAKPQLGRIVLRRHPTHGHDVMIRLFRGQILCSASQGCDVPVRFDEASPLRYTGIEPADHSSESLFLREVDGFVRRLKGAEKVVVGLTFFRDGQRTLHFEPGGLSWD
ncbi:hypothetical protein [uncultured Brevundimonas sp.]|uniref:hypothetical protein n=1 Tax=uncultured Brevundimonas sp. TaxID=213418 RepID=UPI0030EC3230|tara:strand:+ start:4473 stop:5135 length:663 start_codon:yes stop_codon:yes gene_type:complete